MNKIKHTVAIEMGGFVATYTLYKQDGSIIKAQAFRETIEELNDIGEKLQLLGTLDNSIVQVQICRKMRSRK